jgi:hypothetical protein
VVDNGPVPKTLREGNLYTGDVYPLDEFIACQLPGHRILN